MSSEMLIDETQLDISAFIKEVFVDLERDPEAMNTIANALKKAARELTPQEKFDFGLSPSIYDNVTDTFNSPLEFISDLIVNVLPTIDGTNYIFSGDMFSVNEDGKTFVETLTNPSPTFKENNKVPSGKFLKSVLSELGMVDVTIGTGSNPFNYFRKPFIESLKHNTLDNVPFIGNRETKYDESIQSFTDSILNNTGGGM